MNGDPVEVRYAVKVISAHVPLHSDRECKRTMTKDGEEFWVCHDEYGPSGRHSVNGGMPMDVVAFKTRDEALAFASSWQGHPWWVKPKDWKIVEIVPRYVQSGYKEK